MRVLLISANTEQLQMPVLPMGLACVAGATERAGHEVKLLNLMTREDPQALLGSAIRDFSPEAIGISVRNIDDQSMSAPRFLLESVKEVVSVCRSLSTSPIILGGAGYSIYPESSLTYLGADLGIQGEGEHAFPMLLERLSRKRDLSGLPNLVMKNGSSKKDVVRDLDRHPLPIPNGVLSFPTEFKNQKVWLPFQTRRGCPMECSYCSTATIEGRILRKRSPEAAVNGISRFADAGFRYYFFVDNTFNFPPSYAKELCNKLIERKLDIQWRAILYPWKVDEELVAKMARAGCIEVAFGFESGSPKVIRSMNKRFQPEEVRSISRLLDKYDIGRMGFLLLGGPGETKETVMESLEYADSLELESMKLTAGIRIYPFTRLAGIAAAEGLISPHDDLLRPAFYLATGLDGWLQQTIADWLARRPHWHS